MCINISVDFKPIHEGTLSGSLINTPSVLVRMTTPHGGELICELVSSTTAMQLVLVLVSSIEGLLVKMTHSPSRPLVERICGTLPYGMSQAFRIFIQPGRKHWDRDSFEFLSVSMSSYSSTSALSTAAW